VGFDDEAACGGFELHAEDFGSFVMPEGESEQEADDELSHVLQSSVFNGILFFCWPGEGFRRKYLKIND
jgi:hypothetical protein